MMQSLELLEKSMKHNYKEYKENPVKFKIKSNEGTFYYWGPFF
jgi:hypothetical protein